MSTDFFLGTFVVVVATDLKSFPLSETENSTVGGKKTPAEVTSQEERPISSIEIVFPRSMVATRSSPSKPSQSILRFSGSPVMPSTSSAGPVPG